MRIHFVIKVVAGLVTNDRFVVDFEQDGDVSFTFLRITTVSISQDGWCWKKSLGCFRKCFQSLSKDLTGYFNVCWWMGMLIMFAVIVMCKKYETG